MVAASTLMIGNISPAMVEPILDEIGVRRWTNKLMTPMRNLKGPRDDRTDMEWVRVIAADKGADLQWLVDTGGDHDAGGVARAIGRRLGAVEPPCGHSTLIQVRMDTRLLLECRPEGRPRCAPWRLQHRPYTYKARNADFTR